MNVGERLDDTAACLANALALARHRRAAGVDEQITVAVARTRMYQELHRQLVLIAGPDKQQWDLRIAQLSQTLRGLIANASSALPDGMRTISARGPVGTALLRAADALTGANDVLEAHLGDRRTPRSPEGSALAERIGASDNLAALGRLTIAALDLDERLVNGRWLEPSHSAGQRRDLLLAVDRDVRGGSLTDGKVTAGEVAGAGAEYRGFVRDVDPLPPIVTPALWTRVTSARHALAATDAARLHLYNHRSRIIAPEIAAVARASRDIVVALTDVMALTGTPAENLALLRQRADSHWVDVADTAAELRVDVDPLRPAKPVPSTALRAVATWLATRLKTETDLASYRTQTAGTERRTAAWRHVVGKIAVRLCDVAQQLREAVDTAQAESRIHRIARPVSHPDRDVHTGKRLVTSATGLPIEALSRSLREAQRTPATLARMAGVPILPGTQKVPTIATRKPQKRTAVTQPTTAQPVAAARSASQPTSPPAPPHSRGRSSKPTGPPSGGR